MKLGPGLTWSWKRALGVTRTRQRIARTTGVPTTAGGRQRKLGRLLLKLFGLAVLLLAVAATVTAQPWGERLQQQATGKTSAGWDVAAMCDRGNGTMLYVVSYSNAAQVVVVPNGCQKIQAEKQSKGRMYDHPR